MADNSEPSLNARRVLIVDDNLNVAKTLGWMAEMMGREVRLAHDGVSALVVARECLPGVIMLDIGLTDMSGYEVAVAIRADPALRGCVLIAQTGWSQQEYRDRSKAAGFDRHLVKPVTLEVMEELFASLDAGG